jgi:hypothetical protein
MADEDETPIRVADVVEPADTVERVEAYLGFVGRVTHAMDRVRAAEYSGEDTDKLATAVLDGQGRVVAVRLSRLAARAGAAELGPAVLAALAAADRRRQEALVRLAARIQPADVYSRGGHSGG